MNDITKKCLENIIANKQYDLDSINSQIVNIQRHLTENETERDKLIEEIQALKKDLNNQ